MKILHYIISNLLKGSNSNLLVQLFRYVIVGGLSFIVDYGLLYVLTEYVGLYYIVSATLSFIVGLTVNYYISVRWVFGQSKLQNKPVEFSIYAIIGIIGLLFNNILMYIFTDLFHVYYLFSKLITAAIVLIWNFVGRKYILFK